MIDSQKRFVQQARKQSNDSWLFEEISDVTGSLLIQTINFSILLEEIYTGTGL